MNDAIRRETVLKGWKRFRKIELIESLNPTWEDLSKEFGKPIIFREADSSLRSE